MKRLAIVEDHRLFRQALVGLLELDPDLEVIAQAGSLTEGLNGFSERAKHADVAVIDLFLPDGGGEELIRKLREEKENPNLRILVLTVSLDPTDYARAKAAGAHEVMCKIEPFAQIIAAIKRLPTN